MQGQGIHMVLTPQETKERQVDLIKARRRNAAQDRSQDQKQSQFLQSHWLRAGTWLIDFVHVRRSQAGILRFFTLVSVSSGSPLCSGLAPGSGKSESASFMIGSGSRWPSWPCKAGLPGCLLLSSSVAPLDLSWSWEFCVILAPE